MNKESLQMHLSPKKRGKEKKKRLGNSHITLNWHVEKSPKPKL